MVEDKMRKTMLSIGIAILFALFIGYAIETVYPNPVFNDFCEEKFDVFDNEEECVANDGKWTNNLNREVPKPVDSAAEGWCDLTFSCREDYDNAKDSYNINLFFITLIIGIITFIVSVFLLAEAVSSGFMGGGVIVIIYGTLRNWESLSDLWRTLMLGFALSVLVWIGYKKLK